MKRVYPAATACLSLVSLVTVAQPALADVIEIGPADDAEAAMNALQPGDELVLQGGTYSLSGRFGVTIQGTEAAPIVVRAKDGERPHLRRDTADENIVDVDLAEYVTLRGIEFSGGSAGVRLSGARFLTIEDCEIHDTGDVALRANDSGVLYESLRILRNHIHHTNNTGEGMYLGCNSNACQVANSVIQGNHVHDTNQPSVDQGDGIELKEGSYGNVIRDNVIHDTNYPCILTYSAAGNGAPNVIEGNLLWGCGDHGIQSAADALIRNNIILSAASDGIAMQPHQSGAPANLVVMHNTILDADGTALSLRGAVGTVLIANNALYTSSATALLLNGTLDGVTVAGNVIVGGGAVTGTSPGDLVNDFISANFNGAPPNDVFPKAGGALVGAGADQHVAPEDFNGTARNGVADVGAYAFAASGNPGWPLGPGFKPAPGAGGGGGDGGTGGSGSGGASAGTGGAIGVGGSNAGGASGIAGGPGSAGGPGAGGSANAGGGTASGSGGAATSGMDGGSDGGGASSGDDSGCGCHTAQRGRTGSLLGWLGLGLGVIALRRRRA